MFSTIQRGTAHGKSRLTSFLGWVTVFVVCSSYSSPCYIIGNWLDHMLWSNTCRPIRQQHSQAYILNPLRRASHIDALLNSWENLGVRRIHQKKRHDPLNRSEKTNIVPSSVYIGCNCVLLYAFFFCKVSYHFSAFCLWVSWSDSWVRSQKEFLILKGTGSKDFFELCFFFQAVRSGQDTSSGSSSSSRLY